MADEVGTGSRPLEERTTHRGGGEVKTKQSMAPAADINVIMDNWLKTGQAPAVEGATPVYGDFSGVSDYHAALTQIKEAEADFAALPAFVRKACQNDVGVFMEKVQTAEGQQELFDKGLPEDRVPEKAKEPAVETPDPIPSSPPPE